MWNLSLGSPLIGFQSSGDESFGLVFGCSGLQNTQQQLWFWCRLQCTQVTFNLPLLSYNSCWLSGEAWPEEFPLFFSMSGDVLLYLLKLLLRYCRGTVSKQLEVVIEHLGRGCCWQGNMGQLFAAVLSRWPERLQPPWAHKRASHRRGDITWTCAVFFGKGCCVAGGTLPQLGEFDSSSCTWLLVSLLMLCLVSPSVSAGSTSASLWVEWMPKQSSF